MKLVSWQSVLTEHQSHLMRALQTRIDSRLLVVVGVEYLAVRREQGWTQACADDIETCVLPVQGWWSAGCKIIDANPDAVHMFGGIFADRRFFPLMLYAQYRGLKTALMSEPYAQVAVGYFGGGDTLVRRFKRCLRPLLYRLAGVLLGRRLYAMFPISTLAYRQFTAAGLASASTYPFGYFVPRWPAELLAKLPESSSPSFDTLRLVFVGSLIPRKGVRVLIEAVRLAQPAFSATRRKLLLHVYGPGALDQVDLPEGVELKGVIPFGQAQGVIARYDALILPSLHDGWGVVVNEALLQGVPAIVSDTVGAQALVLKSGAGAVFESGNASALARCIEDISLQPERLQVWKNKARAFAPLLEPEVAADYLHACLLYAAGGRGNAPLAPWYS